MDRLDILISGMYTRWLMNKGISPSPIDLTAVDPTVAFEYQRDIVLRARLAARQKQQLTPDLPPPQATVFDKIMDEEK